MEEVNFKNNEIILWNEQNKLIEALLNGTQGMKNGAKTFLPKHTLESDKSYENRLSNSTLLNVFRKTSNFLTGKVFQKDIVFEKSVSKKITNWGKNFNSRGQNINIFARKNFLNGIAKGASFVFVDMPKKDKSIKTKKDEKKAGIRPYFKEISANNILGFIVENGKLIQVRFFETVTRKKNKYETETVERVRVLEIGRWELHEKDNKTDEFNLVDEGEYNIDSIPFLAFIPDEQTSFLTGKSPLYDLAELNLKHWRSASCQDNYLSIGRIPLYFANKIDIEKLPMGVANLLSSDEEGADIKVVEISGKSLEAGRQDLQDIENNMALYGLQQLIPRKVSQTATEKNLSNSDSNSNLGTWATEYQLFLNQIYNIACQLMGIEFPENCVTVNKKFNFGVYDVNELNMLMNAKDGDRPILSSRVVFDEFKKKGVIDDSVSYEDVLAEIEQAQRDSVEFMKLSGNL